MLKLFDVELPKFDKSLAGVEDWRETFEGTCHADTQSIYYRTFDGDMSLDNLRCKTTDNMAELQEFILELCFMLGIVELGRVSMVKLKAGGEVLEHTDEGAYADHYMRFHVVFESNDKVFTVVDGVPHTMDVGGVYVYPHKVPHACENNSDKDRWHLIVDGKLI